jgi:hypothetical protein
MTLGLNLYSFLSHTSDSHHCCFRVDRSESDTTFEVRTLILPIIPSVAKGRVRLYASLLNIERVLIICGLLYPPVRNSTSRSRSQGSMQIRQITDLPEIHYRHKQPRRRNIHQCCFICLLREDNEKSRPTTAFPRSSQRSKNEDLQRIDACGCLP